MNDTNGGDNAEKLAHGRRPNRDNELVHRDTVLIMIYFAEIQNWGGCR